MPDHSREPVFFDQGLLTIAMHLVHTPLTILPAAFNPCGLRLWLDWWTALPHITSTTSAETKACTTTRWIEHIDWENE